MDLNAYSKQATGFAVLDPARQQEISRMGGKAAHTSGRAHEFTSDEARAAGRKGGMILSANRAHMSEIGRRGGLASAVRRAAKKAAATPAVPPPLDAQ